MTSAPYSKQYFEAYIYIDDQEITLKKRKWRRQTELTAKLETRTRQLARLLWFYDIPATVSYIVNSVEVLPNLRHSVNIERKIIFHVPSIDDLGKFIHF
jgi:hypothetical protein